MEYLTECRIAVFGIGGVGGYVCEALVRSGVGAFDLIDDDKVCLTNINRQIQAACNKYQIMAAPNLLLLENGRTYDATVLINHDGTIQGIQKMVHIAQAAGFYEQDYYTPSEEGFRVFETSLGNIGVVVCFDRNYPESIRTEACFTKPVLAKNYYLSM